MKLLGSVGSNCKIHLIIVFENNQKIIRTDLNIIKYSSSTKLTKDIIFYCILKLTNHTKLTILNQPNTNPINN